MAEVTQGDLCRSPTAAFGGPERGGDACWRDDFSWSLFTEIHRDSFTDERGALEVACLAATFDLSSPGLALDAGCGSGRHSRALSARGWSVVGVDISNVGLRHLRSSPATRCHAVRAHLARLPFDRVFDLAICLNTSIGYGKDLEDETAIVRGLRATLRPGGRLVVETIHERAARAGAAGATVLADGTLVLRTHEYSNDHRLLATYTAIRRDGRVDCFTASPFHFSSATLANIFRGAGFSQIAVHEGFSEEPLTYDVHPLRPLSPASGRICVSGITEP